VSFEMTETQRLSYEVPGERLVDAAEVIARSGESGETHWLPRYTYTTTGDEVSDAAVTVGTRIRMPRWTGYTGALAAEQREWDRFYEALLAHERGHLALVVEHLCNIDQRMVGQSEAGARGTWQDALDALRAASDAYDAETDHGRSTGTIIDVGVASEALR
jgi:predicted secreted Zn-dependent protease